MNSTEYKYFFRGHEWYNWHKYRKNQTKYDFETKHSAQIWRFYHKWRISGNHPWEMRRR